MLILEISTQKNLKHNKGDYMRLFNKLIVFFYTMIFIIIGVCLIFIALHIEGRYDLSILIDSLFSLPNLYVTVGLSGILKRLMCASWRERS